MPSRKILVSTMFIVFVMILGLSTVIAAPLEGGSGLADSSLGSTSDPPYQPRVNLEGVVISKDDSDNAEKHPEYLTDQIIVRYKMGIKAARKQSAASQLSATVVKQYKTIPDMQVVKLPTWISVQEALAFYNSQPDVLYAEPDYLIHLDEEPVDSCPEEGLWMASDEESEIFQIDENCEPEAKGNLEWEMKGDGSEQKTGIDAPTATYGEPDEFGYVAYYWDAEPSDWYDLSGGTDTGISDSVVASGPIALGFDFKFYENTYNQIYISRYGYISFNYDDLYDSQSPIPAPDVPNDVIAPHWVPSVDVNYVRYALVDPDVFAIEWNQLVSNHDGDDIYTFEVFITEWGDIWFQYETMTVNGGWYCASTGIEDQYGWIGLPVTDFCEQVDSTHWVEIVRPPDSARGNVDPSEDGLFASPGESLTYDLTIRNLGAFGADTFDITTSSTWPMNLYQADGTTPLTDTDGDTVIDIGSLSQGDFTEIIAEIQVPGSAITGSNNTAIISFTSSIDISVIYSSTLQQAVPTRFAQAYGDQQDMLYLAHPDGSSEFNAGYDGDDLGVAEGPNFYAYIWNDYRYTGSVGSRELYIGILDNAGTSVYKFTDHSAATVHTYDYEPTVAVAPDGTIGVSWRRYLFNSGTGEYNYNIFFATLNYSGTVTHGPINVTNDSRWGDYGEYNKSDHCIEATGDNRFFLTWWQYSQSFSDQEYNDIYYAIFGSDGSTVKTNTKHTNDGGDGEDYWQPSLASLADNRIILVHERSDDTDGANLFYTIFSSAGTTVKSTTNLTSDSWVTWDWISDAVELSDGHILVSWMENDNYHEIYFSIIGPGPSYSILHGPTQLSNPHSDNDGFMSVTADASGNGVITWMDRDSYDWLFYSLVSSGGSIVTPPMIFKSGQTPDPYIYTSFVGYGNTTYLNEHNFPFLPTDDPMGNDLWAMNNWGQTGGTPDADIDAKEAWNTITGTNDTVVAVIDTGIDYTHPDLAPNMWQNPLDCNTNGTDDDGNGYIDDCYGIDTTNGDSDPMDDYGHGTHVAGTIGAVGNNSRGVVGVNWQVDIIACRALDGPTSYISSAIECLDYLANLFDAGVNLVATNNSWGGGWADKSQALYDAIETHLQRGILFIASAGNDNVDNNYNYHYPSSYYLPNLISIASTDHNDDKSGFSCYGSATVDIGAPGSDILSTTPGKNYGYSSGTSMASPHTTGAAALLKANNPALDWIDLKNLIIASGDLIPTLANNTVSGRRLNVNNALSCSGQTVLARLLPEKTKYGLIDFTGRSVELAMLHINCANPNGTVDVTVSPGGEVITLLDDGLGTDQVAGDGIYSGVYNLPGKDTYTFSFPDGSQVEVYPAVPYKVESTPYDWRTISSVNLNLWNNDQGIITPPFPIHFGGRDFDEIYVEDNGVISFDPSYAGWINDLIPVSYLEAAAYPFWDRLYPLPDTDQNIFYDILSTAPNRELVVEWRDILSSDGECYDETSTNITYQVVFFENSSDILFNYQDVIFGGDCTYQDMGESATVGVQVTNDHAQMYSYNSPDLSNNSALLWTLDYKVYLPLIIR